MIPNPSEGKLSLSLLLELLGLLAFEKELVGTLSDEEDKLLEVVFAGLVGKGDVDDFDREGDFLSDELDEDGSDLHILM